MKYLVYILSILPIHDQIDLIGSYQLKDMVYEYGAYQGDGYLMAYSMESEEIYYELTYDLGYDESFFYLADLGYDLMALLVEINLGDEILYQLVVIEHGEIKEEIPISFKIEGTYNHHHYLIIDSDQGFFYFDHTLEFVDQMDIEDEVYPNHTIQFQGQAFVQDISVDEINLNDFGYYQTKIIDGDYTFETVVKVKTMKAVIGEVKDNGYLGQVVIDSPGQLFLDGQAIENGYRLTALGYHHLQIFDQGQLIQEESFYIYPKIVYEIKDQFLLLEDGKIFHEPMRLVTSDGLINLNQENYYGEWISEPGHYQVDIFFKEQIIESYNFEIESSVEGLVDGGIYESVIIYAFGDVLLNDQKITGFVEVKQAGNHHILVKNSSGDKDIHFVIEGQIEVKDTFNYGYLILSLVVIGLLIKIIKRVR